METLRKTPIYSKVTSASHFLGIDRAVAYTLFSRGWQLIAGFGTVLLIALSLTPIQQGFYYTFGSILSLQVFFELGLGYVVTQFASHERAYLNWTSQGVLEGDPTAKARLSSLIRLTLKWYAIASGLMAFFLIPAGLLFFGRSPDSASAGFWQIPWIWLVLSTAGMLLITPVFAVLEGCGLIAEVARFRLGQDLIAFPVLWIGLFAGVGLLAIPFLQTVRIVASAGWLYVRHREFLSNQIKFRLPGVAISWWREVWPMQWKIALSWMSGYFIFQFFNPVLFAYFGAVVAGQMGMSLSITSALNIVAMTWVNTKIPIFGQLIARKEYQSLDRLFFRSLLQALIAVISGGGVLWCTVAVLYAWQIPLSQRILGPLPMALLTSVAVINVIIFGMAAYLRAHKEEPFLWNSVIGAVLVTISTYFLGRAFGVIGMASGYCALSAFYGLGYSTWIFVTKRREWHSLDR